MPLYRTVCKLAGGQNVKTCIDNRKHLHSLCEELFSLQSGSEGMALIAQNLLEAFLYAFARLQHRHRTNSGNPTESKHKIKAASNCGVIRMRYIDYRRGYAEALTSGCGQRLFSGLKYRYLCTRISLRECSNP